MSEGSIRDAQLRRELGVPPSFDLLGHLRDLVRVALPAFLIAAVGAALVFIVRDSGPGVYESQVVAEIRSTSPMYGGDANLGQLTAPYVALSSDSEVVALIGEAMGEGWDAATVEGHIEVSPGPSPTLLIVNATAGSQAEADELTGIVVTSLDRVQSGRNRAAVDASVAELDTTIADRRAELASLDPESPAYAALQGEIDARIDEQRQLRASFRSAQLQLLASPNSSGEKVSPKPAAEAMVAFLALFVVAAEALVALSGRRGTTNSPEWARRLSRRYRTALQIEPTDVLGLPLDTTVMVNQRASLGESILILGGAGVQSDPRSFAGAAADRITRAALTDRWWQTVPTDELALAVVVVASAESERAAVEDAVRALAEIEVPTRLVLLGSGPRGSLFGALGSLRASGSRRATDTSVAPAPAPMQAAAPPPMQAAAPPPMQTPAPMQTSVPAEPVARNVPASPVTPAAPAWAESRPPSPPVNVEQVWRTSRPPETWRAPAPNGQQVPMPYPGQGNGNPAQQDRAELGAQIVHDDSRGPGAPPDSWGR
ncbi:hypothetical protein [Rhodococcus sp. O3]|uniref:hypothetical protein n=1 Tax=Rhodococcus sp. O3 TaxID=3404919 RepID=UPI003B67FAEB